MLVCPGCKAAFSTPVILPAHRYGVMSKECWAAFNALLVYEIDVLGYPEEQRLTIDAYAVQHPQNIPLQKELGIDESAIRASTKSVGRHLIGLYSSLEQKIPLNTISNIMDNFIKYGNDLEMLTTPDHLGAITIAGFSPKFTREEYELFAKKWAASAWDAWSSEHDTVREWTKKYAFHN